MEDRQLHVVVDASGQRVPVNVLHVYEPHVCAHCRSDIDGHAMCIGEPYHAMLHTRCAPHFNFANTWPHEDAVSTYLTLETITQRHGGGGGGSASSSRRSSVSTTSDIAPLLQIQQQSNAISIPSNPNFVVPGEADGSAARPGSSVGSEGSGRGLGGPPGGWPGYSAPYAPR